MNSNRSASTQSPSPPPQGLLVGTALEHLGIYDFRSGWPLSFDASYKTLRHMLLVDFAEGTTPCEDGHELPISRPDLPRIYSEHRDGFVPDRKSSLWGVFPGTWFVIREA